MAINQQLAKRVDKLYGAHPDVHSILNKALSSKIRFCQIARNFQLEIAPGKRTVVSGLTAKLEEVFYPNYDYEVVKKSNPYIRGTGVRNSKEGKNRGTLIHKQLREFTNLTPAEFKRKKVDFHDYSKALIAGMEYWKTEPIIGEMCIYDPDLHIATRIDSIAFEMVEEPESNGPKRKFCDIDCMIMKTKRRRLSCIDFKSGMDDSINHGNGNMMGPLSDFSNSPCNQAQLQVLIEMMILERHYGVPFLEAGWVYHCKKEGVTRIPVSTELRRRRREIYEYFRIHLNEIRENQRLERERKKREKKKPRKRATTTVIYVNH